MKRLIDIYRDAENYGIEIDWFSMQDASSLSVRFPDGTLCIAMDPWKMHTIPEETVCLTHEMGHCCTGNFYNIFATHDIRQKYENKADKWAVNYLIPKADLNRAVAEGHTELWDLAEHFNVTEDFMKKAVCWYKHGNLAVDCYM